MKKTLQIMMVAASALLGAVSCGGGGNGSNANAAVQPISPSDFAQGKMGYEVIVNGVRCQLRGQDGVVAGTSATLDSGVFYLHGDDGGSYKCQITYRLNAPIAEAPTQAVISIVFSSSDAMKEDKSFKTFWGITDASKMQNDDQYTLTLSFRNAAVTAKSEVNGETSEQSGSFWVVPFTSPDGGAGEAQGA